MEKTQGSGGWGGGRGRLSLRSPIWQGTMRGDMSGHPSYLLLDVADLCLQPLDSAVELCNLHLAVLQVVSVSSHCHLELLVLRVKSSITVSPLLTMSPSRRAGVCLPRPCPDHSALGKFPESPAMLPCTHTHTCTKPPLSEL